MAASVRRFAAACRLILDTEATGRKITVRTALEQAGTNRYFLDKSEAQLKLLGRHRGQKLLEWLLKADLDLKGASRTDPRLILETFLVRLGAPQLKTPITP
jgi:hypothetical protein